MPGQWAQAPLVLAVSLHWESSGLWGLDVSNRFCFRAILLGPGSEDTWVKGICLLRGRLATGLGLYKSNNSICSKERGQAYLGLSHHTIESAKLYIPCLARD